MKRKYILQLVLFCFVSFCSLPAMAQPDPGGEVDVPIDGGLSLLLAAGVAYGAKKMYSKRGQKNVAPLNEDENSNK